MGKLGGWTGTLIAASLMATSMPAMARPGNGWGGGHHGGWGRHHRRHDDVDAGDVILGAVILGGIFAALSSASKKKTADGRGAGSGSNSTAEDAAVEACADAAEREAGNYAVNAQVEDITNVSRDGVGWRVEGVVASGDENYRDSRTFLCGTRAGRVDFIRLGEATASR